MPWGFDVLPVYDDAALARGRSIFIQRVFIQAYGGREGKGCRLMVNGDMVPALRLTPAQRAAYLERVFDCIDCLPSLRREAREAHRGGMLWAYCATAIQEMEAADG